MLNNEQLDEVSMATKGGIIDKIVQRARARMHQQFIKLVDPQNHETILDVGASANPAFIASNYLEHAYPFLNITACGLGYDNPHWRKLYPKINYFHGDARHLPFEDKSFDIVYTHAVIEHVGNFYNQAYMIREAVRVARRAVWITTPNRWHPIEFHTVLPLIHWLPKPLHRKLLKKLGRNYFANENTLNLLDKQTLLDAIEVAQQMVVVRLEANIHVSRFLGLTANLLLHITKS